MKSSVKERILNICTELGEDMDSEACKALREYVKSCPNCDAFVDSVKKTVELYQGYSKEYPADLRKDLLKKLNLD